jgi:hypothetical protein
MMLERQHLLDRIHSVPDEELIEELGMAFALYEKEMLDQITFLREILGDLTVVTDPEVARLVAGDALKEAEYRWRA